MRLIALFKLLEKSQCFLQRGCAARASSYVFREYGKALIGLLSAFSYNCLGICPHTLVLLRLYFVMYCYKLHEQFMGRCFRKTVQSLVLLLRGKQYNESYSTITAFCDMCNQLLLLRRIRSPFTYY